jgi:glycosyltransferase involved in cell wall biosynthesis
MCAASTLGKPAVASVSNSLKTTSVDPSWGLTGSDRADEHLPHMLLAAPSDFESFPFGGTVSLVRDLLASWGTADRWRISLIGLTRSKQTLKWTRIQIGDAEYPFMPICQVTGLIGRSVRFAFTSSLLRHGPMFRRLCPDLIYAHSPECARALALVCRGVPLVLHCHGVHNPLQLSRFRIARGFGVPLWYERIVYRPALSAARLVLVNSDHSQYEGFITANRRSLRGQVERVPATVDLAVFRPLDRNHSRSELNLPTGGRIAIFVGRLEEPKGLELVLRAIHGVRARSERFHLLVLGDGTHRESLESLTSQLGICPDVTFLGHKQRTEIPRYLSAADVFVSGTLREAVSMALLEALACGVPGVVTDGGGARELIVDGYNGFVLDDRDPDLFGRRLIEMAARREAVARDCVRVAQRYSANAVAQEMLAKFECVLNPGVAKSGRFVED